MSGGKQRGRRSFRELAAESKSQPFAVRTNVLDHLAPDKSNSLPKTIYLKKNL